MQSNLLMNGGKQDVSPAFTSTYLKSTADVSKKVDNTSDINQQWTNTSLSSSDSSGSWTQEGGLPPPPQECQLELPIKPSSVPNQPAPPGWDNVNSDDDSDDDEGEVRQASVNIKTPVNGCILADSDSGSELESQSECTTEIYVPQRGVNPTSVTASVPRRPGARVLAQRCSDVIPSVSTDNICGRAFPIPVKLSTTSEDIATNIDSGISNETSNVTASHQSTVVKKGRLSVSSSSHYSSSYSCGSRGQIPSPTIGQSSRMDDIAVYMREAKVSRTVSFLSACYAAILIILGVIFPLFKVTAQPTDTRGFEGFYIYLYGLSLFFLIYVYITVIKHKQQNTRRRKKSAGNITAERTHATCHFYHHGDIVPMVGSLFIRVAVVVFCVGSVLDNSLEFGIHVMNNCSSAHILNIIQPLAQAVFMLSELYFIFNNTKMNVRQYPIVAKFGLMHLLATNLCIWILSVIMEVFGSYTASKESMITVGKVNQSDVDDKGEALLPELVEVGDRCLHKSILTSLSEKSTPYTYPCIAQFCILVTCILYVMWRHVDSDSDTQCSDCKEHTKKSHFSATRTIDCSNTSLGLLVGILSLLGAIAALIAFFVLTTNNYQDSRATLVIHNYQIAMYLLMTVLAVVVLLKLRTLDHNGCRLTLLEDTLFCICVIALFANDLIGIISGIFYINKLKGLLVLATSIVELFQSVIQIAAIVMGLKLCLPDLPDSPTHVTKPGRECVTFLIVANMSLWILSLFNDAINQGHEIQISLVGQLLWVVITHVINPFVIFYHLFSASCFVDIWYNAYRQPSSSVADV